jgi:hypothetical protein
MENIEPFCLTLLITSNRLSFMTFSFSVYRKHFYRLNVNVAAEQSYVISGLNEPKPYM